MLWVIVFCGWRTLVSRPVFGSDFVAMVRQANGELCPTLIEELPGGVVGEGERLLLALESGCLIARGAGDVA